MTVMLLKRSTTLQSTPSQKKVENNELPFLILFDIQENTEFNYITCSYDKPGIANIKNLKIEENKHFKNVKISDRNSICVQASTWGVESSQYKKTKSPRISTPGGIAMRYYRLWIYACNIVILVSAISFAAAVSRTFFFSSDLRRYIVPGLPKAYDPTALYAYFALTVQFGVVQLLGCIAVRRLNAKLLHAYWLLILSLLFGDVVIGIAWVFRFEKMRADLRPTLRLRLQVEYNKDTQFSGQWDQLQREFSCCGVTGPLDFGFQWPQSCCSSEITFSINLENNQNNSSITSNNSSNLTSLEPCLGPHSQGCEDQLLLWLRKTADLLFVLGFCVIAFTKLCFLGILRYEIREMIQKIQMMKDPLPQNVPFPQSFYPSQSLHHLQQKQQIEMPRNNENVNKKTHLPDVTTNTASGATSLLIQTDDLASNKHPLIINSMPDGGVDSDTNSHCALILEESTPPTKHHSTIMTHEKNNGNNNYELHELNRRLPISNNDNELATDSLSNSGSLATQKMAVIQQISRA